MATLAIHGRTTGRHRSSDATAQARGGARRLWATAALIAALALPVRAHHSFSAEFDAKKPVTLTGEVVMMEWVNPHSWLHIDVKGADGAVQRWKIEGGSPSVLMRLGWNRNSLPAGTKVTVVGSQAKDGSLRASSRDLRFPDGRRLDLGGSGPDEKKGVPTDK